MKKYELVLDDTRKFYGETLYRIRALKDFTCIDGFEVHKGDLGGYVQTEDNLSQDGLCWVRRNGEVYGTVCDNGMVCGNGKVWGTVCDNGEVYDDGEVWGTVRDNGVVCGNGKVWGTVHGQGAVCNGAIIRKDGDVFKPDHVLTVGAIGSRNDITTFYRNKDNDISVTCDCFNGKIDGFWEWVVMEYGCSKHGQAYLKAIELAKLQIDLG